MKIKNIACVIRVKGKNGYKNARKNADDYAKKCSMIKNFFIAETLTYFYKDLHYEAKNNYRTL